MDLKSFTIIISHVRQIKELIRMLYLREKVVPETMFFLIVF